MIKVIPASVVATREATEAFVKSLFPTGELLIDEGEAYVAVGSDIVAEFGTDTGFADGKPTLDIYE
jgi:hypothetical protein